MKEIEDTNKWKNIPWSELKEPILFKCPYYPKLSSNSMQSIKILMAFFTEIEHTILKFVWPINEPQ